MSKHTLRFYPLGNADTTLISLANGKQILWDYAHMKAEGDEDDERCDLPKELDKHVTGDFDIVTFTHADRDHIKCFSEYFYLKHAKKYQSDDRKKIKELWVPAAVLLDKQSEDEAKILKAEARCRLRNKEDILVFSKPQKMKDWCDEQNDISYDEVKHLFVDAGKLVPGITLDDDGIEFFSHSPFQSENLNIDRNGEAIVVQATFDDQCKTKLILGSDCTSEIWERIVEVTRHFGNDERLSWDVFRVSHHCSYLSLSLEKGADQTEPEDDIKWLFEDQGKIRSRLISSSKPIPIRGSEEDKDSQPPHRQAASYYKELARDKKGEFLVTMEHKKNGKVTPIVMEIDKDDCAKVIKESSKKSSIYIGTKKPPRAGF